MTIWRLIGREIAHRKLNFAIASVSGVIAVAVLVGGIGVLNRHDSNTRAITAGMRAQTAQRVDDERKQVAGRVAKRHREVAAGVEDRRQQVARSVEQKRQQQALHVAEVQREVTERVQTLRNTIDERMASLNDDLRKITKKMGFNIYVLPKGQNLTDYFADGYASKFMPEEYVTKLAASKVLTVRHLLPILEQKVAWTEQGGRKIILIGTRGEIPITHKTAKTPLTDPVPKGKIVLGHEIWTGLGLEVDSKLTLLGTEFTVAKRHPERGTKDDITVWIHLATAQKMLDKVGKINAIFALECSCAWADLPKVRAEITRILPETQVKELHTQALARAESRHRAQAEGEALISLAQKEAADAVAQAQAAGRKAIDNEETAGRKAIADEQVAGQKDIADEQTDGDKAIADKQTAGERAVAEEAASRESVHQQIVKATMVLMPLALVGAAAWVGLLAYMNVRQRRGEIGILRAIGVSSRQIAGVFLVRAALVGLVGGPVGCAIGLVVAHFVEAPAGSTAQSLPISVGWLVAAALTAPILCALAGWAPAMLAGRQDPAVVLQQEAA